MLMFAAINGDDSSVKLLLADGRVDRNIAMLMARWYTQHSKLQLVAGIC